MKFIAAIIGLVLLLYVVAASVLFFLQRHLIYYPAPVVGHEFRELKVESRDGTELNLIVINEGRQNAVIYFGGNGESVALSAEDLQTALTDKTVYLANYRGYGGSEGRPSETKLFADAVDIFDTVSAHHTGISVIGRSLGSGVACWLAKQRPVMKLVLVTPFDSLLNIARTAYPFFPVNWLLKDQYLSIDYAAEIDSPVLAIIAEQDEIIPMSSSNRLVDAFAGYVQTNVLAGAGHNNVQLQNDYYSLLRKFL